MGKFRDLSQRTLSIISVTMLLGVFVTLSMSFTPVEEVEEEITTENDSTTITRTIRKGHYVESGTCGSTDHKDKDYGKASAYTTGNGTVKLTTTGGGVVDSTTPASGVSAATNGSSVIIQWNCNETTTSGTEANHKRKFTFTATPNDGYKFDGWSTTESGAIAKEDMTFTEEMLLDDWNSKDTYTSTAKAKTLTYYAHFSEKVMATITFGASANGSYTYTSDKGNGTVSSTTSPNPSVTTDGTVTLTAGTAASGYKFFGWYTLEGSTENFISYSQTFTKAFDSNTTIYAKFIPTSQALFAIKGTSQTFYDLNVAATKAASSSSKVVYPTANGTVPAGDYTIPSGVTLLVPFDDAYTNYTTLSSSYVVHASWSAPKCYTQLTLANGCTINVMNNASINVAAKEFDPNGGAKGVGAVATAYGRIDMQEGSYINVHSGGKLYCWGYITGNGMVTIENGATLIEMFQTYNRGGTAFSSMRSTQEGDNCFPMNQYYIQNVEAYLRVNYGATETVWTSLYIRGDLTASGTFIGKDDTGLFDLSNGSYLIRKYNPTTDRITYDMFGSGKINHLSITIYIPIDTKNYTLPITNNMTINCHTIDNSPATITIPYRVALLPGAELSIDENVTIDVSKKLYIYDKDEWTGKSFAYLGTDVTPICYSPTKTKTRTSADLQDAKVEINGMLKCTGEVYTTKSGANICSNGSGTILFGVKAGTDANTYQAVQSGSSITDTKIPITAAQLHNNASFYNGTYKAYGSFEYLPTAGTAANTTIAYANGHWGWVGIWKNYDGTILKVANTCLESQLAAQKPDDPTKPADDDVTYTFKEWTAVRDATKQEIVYTATYTAAVTQIGQKLDIVDWSSQSLTLNMNGYSSSFSTTERTAAYKNGWKISANGATETEYTSSSRNTDRTLTISFSADLVPNEQIVIEGKDKNGNTETRQTYTVPYIITENKSLSSLTNLNENSDIYLKSSKLIVDTDATINNIIVCADAELYIASGKTLTVTEQLRLRTLPFSSAILSNNGTLNAENMYYSRIVADNSVAYQFAIPYDVTLANTIFSNGKQALHASHYVLMSYDAAARAENGKGGNWEKLTDEKMLKNTGYQLLSSSAYYYEILFPVDYSQSLDDAVSVIAYSGEAGESSQGWNYICSPKTSRQEYTYSGDVDEALKITILNEDNTSFDQYPATVIYPAMPFYYQASADGELDFSGSSIIKRKRSYTMQIPVQWIRIYYNPAAEDDITHSGDQTSIYLHPDKYSMTYERGYDVEKMSKSIDRPRIYSSLIYGDLAFAALPDKVAESGIPLVVSSNKNVEMRISLESNPFMSRISQIWLIDNKEGTETDLMCDDYVYYADQATETERFILRVVFADEEADVLTDTDKSLIQNADYCVNGRVITAINEIQCFDAVGKLIGIGKQIVVPAQGMYVIKNDEKIEKVFVK